MRPVAAVPPRGETPIVSDTYFSPEHTLLRQTFRHFVETEIIPFVDDWEEAGVFPRDLYGKAAGIGLLNLGYPEEYGGIPADLLAQVVAWEELARAGSGGLGASLGSLHIALPPIVKHGTAEQKARFLPGALAGERIAALAVTEPGGGSDVAGITTRARRDGDVFVVDGAKTFITSGVRADQFTVAVRTGDPGHRGISVLVIEADTPGFTRSGPLKKMGWWASDTAELFFDGCRVPASNLIGVPGGGFRLIMENFQVERLQMAVVANVTAELALAASLNHASARHTFGEPLAARQVIRHKLVDMATKLEISRQYTYSVADRLNRGEVQVKEVSMAKLFATETSDFITDAAVQIFGGFGYMREYLVERLYRDNRVLSIGGGTTEIMKEIIAKHIL
ncbi:MAG: acyl-CoA dehydrogenase family protein [Acidimicrobiia bacterium]|nr:acyl-CoA dehydrogenase family protein [Acidimicrobiia bacterium]